MSDCSYLIEKEQAYITCDSLELWYVFFFSVFAEELLSLKVVYGCSKTYLVHVNVETTLILLSFLHVLIIHVFSELFGDIDLNRF